MKGYIYGLIDHTNNELVYIGSTLCVEDRYDGHLRNILRNPYKTSNLYKYFLDKKIIPDIVVLEEVEFERKDELYTKEAYWIVVQREKGSPLFNKNIPGKTTSKEDTVFVTVKKSTYISVLKYIEEDSLKMTVHEFFDMAAMSRLEELKNKEIEV